MFEHMNSITLQATFVAKESGNLPPYLGSTIRGIFGHTLHRMVDLQTYKKYFSDTKTSAGSVKPFVIYVSTQDKTSWHKGDQCVFDLTYFGINVEGISLIIHAIQQMNYTGWGAQRISFELLKITNPVTQKLVWRENQLWLKNASPQPLICNQVDTSFVYMDFVTPLRLEKSHELIEEPSFADIIRALARRMSLISQAYTKHQMEWNLEKMLAEAEKVQMVDYNWQRDKFRRYSMNQKDNELRMDNIIGSVSFKGEITPFTPLLEAGKCLHIGRDSTHEFGYYTVDYS